MFHTSYSRTCDRLCCWGRVLKVLLVSLRTGQVSPAGEMSVKWYILEVKKDIPVQYIRENYSA
jgi:hypothetical protein